MVKLKLVLAFKPLPFSTVSVIVVTPLYTATGVRVTLQRPEVSGPVSTIPVARTKAVLLETHVTTSEVAAVTASCTVNASAEVEVPIFIN